MQPRKHSYGFYRTAVIRRATSCTTIRRSPGCELRTSMSITRMAKSSSPADTPATAGDWGRQRRPKVRAAGGSAQDESHRTAGSEDRGPFSLRSATAGAA